MEEINYNPLFKMLIDKNLKKYELESVAGISHYAMNKITKGQRVSEDVIKKICKALNCEEEDIMTLNQEPDAESEIEEIKEVRTKFKKENLKSIKKKAEVKNMGRIITVANQKGGVCKTTVVRQLSTSLAMNGYKVLVVDGDSQGNLSSRFTYPAGTQITRRFADLLNFEIENRSSGEEEIEYDTRDTIYHTTDNVDVIFTPRKDSSLKKASEKLVGIFNKTTVVKEILDQVKDDYDFIFIDSAPTETDLLLSFFNASDEVLIPITPEVDAFMAIKSVINNIKLIRKVGNKNLVINGILIAAMDKTNLSSMFLDEVKNLDVYSYNTTIPRKVAVREADLKMESIFSYEKKDSKGNYPVSDAYRNFTKEFLEREKALTK